MGAVLTSPLNLVPTTPTRRPFLLKCRFTIGPGECHRAVGGDAIVCRHMDRAMYEAGSQFLDAMRREGWDPVDGQLLLTRGPIPVVPRATSIPKVPRRPARALGLHPRFSEADGYDSPLVRTPTLDTTDGWQYELSGWFVRPMMPTIMTVEAARHVEANRAARRAARRSGQRGR